MSTALTISLFLFLGACLVLVFVYQFTRLRHAQHLQLLQENKPATEHVEQLSTLQAQLVATRQQLEAALATATGSLATRLTAAVADSKALEDRITKIESQLLQQHRLRKRV